MKQLTFFLIDDDQDDRDLFGIALNETDHTSNYISAGSCGDALKMLGQMTVLPDYIFLDLNMPQVNGSECLDALKKNVRLAQIPVVIFSTSSDLPDKRSIDELGAIGFITKPSKVSELTNILNHFISSRPAVITNANA